MRDSELVRLLAEQVARQQCERRRLHAYAARLEEITSGRCRDVLDADATALEGYLLLDQEESRFTAFALRRHSEWVLLWYRLLTLFKQGVFRLREDPLQDPAPVDQLLRLLFIAASGGSAKLILDTTLAGYYTQALALVRHLFETWLRLEYIRLRPEMADAWFMSPNGEDPRPPNENTIHNTVRKRISKDGKPLVERVLDTICRLNKMAHPSEHTLQQTKGAKEHQYNVGASYDADLALAAFHEGASAFRLILVTFQEIVPQPSDWKAELASTIADHEQLINEEFDKREASAQKG